MNWQHLQAFLWLRWRLSVNQWRRGGTINLVLMMIIAVGIVLMAVPLFIGCLVGGLFAFPKAAPIHLLLVWDGVVIAFLFIWGIGLLTELQRSDGLSLSKFLHLPVSMQGAFVINYISSLLRLSLIAFTPILVGLALALPFAKGITTLVTLPLLAAFLLMITAVTYQFQGWLAALMSNPRRRRAIIVGSTALFVLLCQLPNLLNFIRPWGKQQNAAAVAQNDEFVRLDRALQASEIDAQEHASRRQQIVDRHKLAEQQARDAAEAYWTRMVRTVNMVLPIGWLPLGVMAAAEGNPWPSVLGGLAMTLIGSASLWRAYRTTIGLFQGVFTARTGRTAVARPTSLAGDAKPRTLLLEARLPRLSEPVSAIALGGIRSLMRSPEAKMVLFLPVVLAIVFGTMLLRMPAEVPLAFRPLIAIGAMVMVLIGVLQLMANQFGFDRDGFRVFVLSAVPRRDILLGKNLAYVPLVFGLAGAMLIITAVVCPLRWDHLLALVPQFISMYLLFCILMNLLSICSPLPTAQGSLKPARPKLSWILLQLVMFSTLFPLMQGPTLLPFGIEAALTALGWDAGIPIYLLLALAECVAVIFLYRWLLGLQGNLFQAREQKILEVVTNRAA